MLAQRSLSAPRRAVPCLPALSAPARCLSASRHSRPAVLQQRQPLVPEYGRPRCTASLAPASSTEQATLGASQALAALTVPTSAMAKGLSSFSGGATLQRSKLNQSQKIQQWDAKTDNSGGGGIGGKGIFNGGGGGDDGGDDDDYFNDGEDGDDGGDDGGFFRMLIQENYSMAAIGAVLSEWYRTFDTLPLMLRQAVQMGLFSSQQLVRFCSMDNRPTVARTVARSLPTSVSRGLVGRMMADPAFLQKVVMEAAITACSSLAWEAQQRGERFGRELDFVAINTLSLMAANACLVWSIAPSRSFGSPAKMPWQQMLAKLPNNVADAGGPRAKYSVGSRAASFFAKGAQLAVYGAAAGAVMGLGDRAATALRRRSDPTFSPAVQSPSVARGAQGMAVSLGGFSNARYQIVATVDSYLFGHSTFLWSYLAFSGILRVISQGIGEPTRRALMGLPNSPPAYQPAQQLRQPQRLPAAARPAARRTAAQPSSSSQPVKRRVKKTAAKGFAMSAAAASS